MLNYFFLIYSLSQEERWLYRRDANWFGFMSQMRGRESWQITISLSCSGFIGLMTDGSFVRGGIWIFKSSHCLRHTIEFSEQCVVAFWTKIILLAYKTTAERRASYMCLLSFSLLMCKAFSREWRNHIYKVSRGMAAVVEINHCPFHLISLNVVICIS